MEHKEWCKETNKSSKDDKDPYYYCVCRSGQHRREYELRLENDVAHARWRERQAMTPFERNMLELREREVRILEKEHRRKVDKDFEDRNCVVPYAKYGSSPL